MNRHVPGCLVTGYEDLIPGLTLPDAEDRHVLAAAIRCRADLIVIDDYLTTLERQGLTQVVAMLREYAALL